MNKAGVLYLVACFASSLVAPPASALGCQAPWFDYQPCELELRAGTGGVAQGHIDLWLRNPTTSSLEWAVWPATDDTSECDLPPPVGSRLSFQPYTGSVVPLIEDFERVVVSVDASGLPPGHYPHVACVEFPFGNGSPVAIPVTLMVGDAMFGDGFEASGARR